MDLTVGPNFFFWDAATVRGFYQSVAAVPVARVVPILPVPLVAAALLSGPADAAALRAEVERLAASLQADDAVLRLNPQGLAETVDEAVLHLTRRGLIGSDLQVRPGKGGLLAFYAASVQQRMESHSAPQQT
mgnify:CR=1 FL=1